MRIGIRHLQNSFGTGSRIRVRILILSLLHFFKIGNLLDFVVFSAVVALYLRVLFQYLDPGGSNNLTNADP